MIFALFKHLTSSISEFLKKRLFDEYNSLLQYKESIKDLDEGIAVAFSGKPSINSRLFSTSRLI